MKAELITIGDEILIGQIVDTNSAWMAEQLNLIGVNVVQISSISDGADQIKIALDQALSRADIVLITGGLGPTKDDITKKTLAEYFNDELVTDQSVIDHIEQLFGRFGKTITDLNRQQADLPSKCTALKNRQGTAPGMWFDHEGKVIVSMPGVPYEMKGLMKDEVIPRITEFADLPVIVHRTVLTTGIGESWLSDKIEGWEVNLPSFVKLAYLPSPGRVRLRLSASGSNRNELMAAVDTAIGELKSMIGHLIYGEDTDSLQEVVGQLLLERNATLSTAESCTGGSIAGAITSVSGASAYFLGSIVSYDNEVKIGQLGVKPETLDAVGAVSEEVVRQMAEGVKSRLKTDYSIATSGIAGPTGGTEEKPVGTVWIAVSGPNGTQAKKFLFGDVRERNISRSVTAALNMLRIELNS